jgi:hypothetical protein
MAHLQRLVSTAHKVLSAGGTVTCQPDEVSSARSVNTSIKGKFNMPDFHELKPSSRDLFPCHGWIEGVTGFRFLRLPILRLFQYGHPTYTRFEANNLAGIWLQTRSPYRTLRHLAVALRDLHAELRLLTKIANEEWLEKKPSDERDRSLTRQREGNERCEVLLISIFILLRRLADDITDSLRPVLFKNWRSAPSQFKKFVKLAESGDITNLGPYYDAELLSKVFLTHGEWLQRLRKQDGIRDTLVHWPHYMTTNPSGIKPKDVDKFAWHISAALVVQTPDGPRAKQILPMLLQCLSEACDFMTALMIIIEPRGEYARTDDIFVTGLDNDAIGFWPSIEKEKLNFPLMD